MINHKDKTNIVALWRQGHAPEDIADRLRLTREQVVGYLHRNGMLDKQREPSLPKVKFLTMPDPLQGTGV